MRIYFYDGSLCEASKPGDEMYYRIDAMDGPTTCKINIQGLSDMVNHNEIAYDNVAILSNSLVALSHEYGWNEREGHTDIYIWRFDLNKYVRIDELTDKEIRKAHNIEKMYRAGVFNPD